MEHIFLRQRLSSLRMPVRIDFTYICNMHASFLINYTFFLLKSINIYILHVILREVEN